MRPLAPTPALVLVSHPIGMFTFLGLLIVAFAALFALMVLIGSLLQRRRQQRYSGDDNRG